MVKDKISLIVPCYNEEESIEIFFETLEKLRSQMDIDFEYIFVNDGSKDKTLNILRDLAKQQPKLVKYISFSRNFGKESAMYAGLVNSTGDYTTIMDVDLQHPPELLPKMYELLKSDENEYDCIGARRVSREGEPLIRSFFSKAFYNVINKISDTKIVGGAADYRLMPRKMVDAVLQLTEYNRFSKGIFSWVGFNTLYLEYNNRERKTGETTWSFWSLLKYSIDGIIDYSVAPLKISSIIGLLAFIVSIGMAIYLAIKTMIFDNPTDGWTTLVCLVTGLGGLQLLCLGIIGEYLGKTFLETKKRPIYIVKETEKDIV